MEIVVEVVVVVAVAVVVVVISSLAETIPPWLYQYLFKKRTLLIYVDGKD